jgi:hypothetical protein
MQIVTVGGNGDFSGVVAKATPAMAEIAHAARALIADVLPGVTEVPWAKQGTAGYGVGPKKMSQHFAYLAAMKAHVNLGFMYGADLDDPAGLLQGSGKAMRHVELRSLDDVKRPEVRALLTAASTHLPKRL